MLTVSTILKTTATKKKNVHTYISGLPVEIHVAVGTFKHCGAKHGPDVRTRRVASASKCAIAAAAAAAAAAVTAHGSAKV